MPQLDTTQQGIADFYSVESYTDVALFTGENDIHTGSETFAENLSLPAHSVMARNINGELVLAVSGDTAVAISMTSVTTGAGVTQDAPVYYSGCFNPERLHFDASFDTDAKKKAAFGEPSVSNLTIKALR